MHTLRKYKFHVLSLILCIALLAAGPAWPVYASVLEEEDESDYSDYEDTTDYVDDYEDDVDEPGVNDAEVKVLQEKISEIDDQLKKVQQEQARIEANITNAKSEKEKAEQVRNSYGQQVSLKQNEIATLQQRINTLEEKITLLEQTIAQKELKIDEKQAEIDFNYDLFKKRLRAGYMQDNGTVLGLLLGADSFAEFLTDTEYMARIADHDQKLMRLLTEERIAIEEDKADLETDKASVESDKTQIEEDKAATEAIRQELAIKYNAAEQEVHSLAAQEAAFYADLEKNKAAQQKMRAEMDQLFKEIEFITSPYAGGSMAWPLPGHSTISSWYGKRFGGADFHTGIDITGTGCNGASIKAANDGVVSFVNTSFTKGEGYGIYVIVDHGVGEDGKNISTLYAHCTSITVSQGQTVSKGQEIAKVGSTGWSTGPHLHFEVRIGTQAVNPAPYIGL